MRHCSILDFILLVKGFRESPFFLLVHSHSQDKKAMSNSVFKPREFVNREDGNMLLSTRGEHTLQ